jgi:hypothetical protein
VRGALALGRGDGRRIRTSEVANTQADKGEIFIYLEEGEVLSGSGEIVGPTVRTSRLPDKIGICVHEAGSQPSPA